MTPFEDIYHPPSYFIRKRFLRNRPAVFGLGVIVLAILITLLGYLVMPDKTPDANDGSARISRQKPGFSVTILRLLQKHDVEQRGFLSRLYFGQESPYTIEPISDYRFVGDQVHFQLFGSGMRIQTGLLEATRSTYASIAYLKADTLPSDLPPLYTLSVLDSFTYDTLISYLDPKKQLQSIRLDELREEFAARNIETRFYPLGTDLSGRDVLSRLLFGTRISLLVGLVTVLISVLLGVTLGALAGYFGGWIDDLVIWFMTVVWSVPSIMLVIAISIAFQDQGLFITFAAVGFTMWVEIARVVRGQMKGIKKKLYIRSAQAFGLRNDRIIFNHILPNIIGPIIVSITANFANAILIEAGLSFLGLGVQMPTPSWGMMLQEGFRSTDSWHLIFFPSICISLLVLAFNLLGNGLRDAYDPYH
ncbi:MAG: ABC transporter permease [Bernardetiaceae bacterium]